MPLTEQLQTIQVHQQTEYDPLRSVIMCLANPFDRDPTALFANGDEAMEYQAARNRARPYDVDLVHVEQHAFIAVMKSLGIEVLLAQPVGECISQHYPRDIGFVIGDVFVVARPRRAYRHREMEGLNAILPQLSRVVYLDDGCIEGGDVFVNGDEVIVGYGEETNPAGVAALQRCLETNRVERTIVTLDLAERGAIHTDCKFNIIGKNLAIANPAALTPESLKLVEQRFEVIPATPEETMDVAINTLVIGDHKLVMSASAPRLAEEVAKRGIEPILLDYSEVNALPGSFRCTTLPLIRAH
jgi:N-dimethylarginine dimethylaminohydrolase